MQFNSRARQDDSAASYHAIMPRNATLRKAQLTLPDRSLQPINSQNFECPSGMILSCPSCSARFNVKAEALGTKGRTVKCAKCAHKWHAMPEVAAAPAAAPPAPPAPAAEAAPPPPPPAPAVDEAPPPPPPHPEAEETPPPPPPPAAPEAVADEAPERPPIPPRQRGEQQAPQKRSTLKWWIALAAVIVVLSSAGII